MSTSELVMIVGGAIAIILGAVDALRSNGQDISAWGVCTLGVVFVLLALI